MPHNEMRAFYEWIRYLVLTNYSLESLVAIEMGQCSSGASVSNSQNHHGCTIVTTPKMGDTSAFDTELQQFIHRNYAFEFASIWRNIGVLIGMLLALQVAVFLTLRFVSHLKR